MFGSNQPQIEEGATVRERQKIFSIPDISQMQVNTKVHESQIDKITPQLKAQIRVDAFADQSSTARSGRRPPARPGQLLQLRHQGLHDPHRIDDPLAGLRPGMTAQVEILVDRLENVLSVPVQAILQYNGKDHVTKKVGDRYDRVEVTLGASNDKFVEVTKGLDDGDVVVLNPMSLMSEDEKREAFRQRAKESKKDWGKGEPGEAEARAAGAAGKGGGAPARAATRPRPRPRPRARAGRAAAADPGIPEVPEDQRRRSVPR